MERIKRDWSSLPEHLVVSIANRLHTRFDILCFRAVCLSFRAILPPTPPQKLQFPPSILTNTNFLRGPNPSPNDLFVLVECTIYAIQPPNLISNENNESSQTWLVKVEESEPGRVKLRDPLSRIRFKNLSGKLPKYLNLLDYRVTEIKRSYAFESAALEGKYPFPSKVIFTTFLDETDDGFAVMAKFGGRKLSLWRNVDKKWSNIHWGPEYLQDIIYRNHKFYVVDSNGLIMTVDESLVVAEIAAGPQGDDPNLLFVYLVESCKDLLLIAKYRESKDDFQFYFRVFRLDEEKFMWVSVFDELELENTALFVGGDSSYSVSAKEFPGCKGNCVYFIKNSFSEKYGYPGEDAWIFSLEDCKSEKLTDFPGYSNLFWPPASWLKQHSCSAGSSWN